MSWLSGGEFHAPDWTSSSYPGLGILFEDLPTDGESGGSPLLNDGGVNGDEVRWELLTQTGLTVDAFYEDGSFESTGTGSFTYRSFVNNSSVGDFTVFVNSAGATVTSSVSAGIPIPTASAALTITQEGTVASIISAGIPKPIAAAAVNLQAAPIQLTVSAGIPKPTASAVMYTGEPSSYNWYEHIDEMIADGRFIVIADGSRFITFND